MSNKTRHPSYQTCVADILQGSPQPMSIDALVRRIEGRRPVGRGVRSAVYQAINKLYQAVPVAPGRFGWLSFLLKDQLFRHTLSPVEVRRGHLLLDELEHAVLFPDFFQEHRVDSRTVEIDLMGGPTLRAQPAIERSSWALHLGVGFSEWVDLMGGNPQDDLLIRVEDAAAGRYAVRLQPREARQEAMLEQRNQLLVQIAEDIVSGDRKMRGGVPVWELAAQLIARGVFAHPVPPDDMHYVLHEQSQLVLVEDLGYTLDQQPSMVSRRGRGSGRKEHDEHDPRDGRLQIDSSDIALFEEYLSDDRSVDPAALEADMGMESFDSDDMTLDEAGEWESFLADMTSDESVLADHCDAYQSYLANFYSVETAAQPLSHMEFHLLEAELEMLVSLEQEFQELMEEQSQRKQAIAARLFIDLDEYFDDDWDDEWDDGWNHLPGGPPF